jgi:hypothetical protein
VLMLVVFYIASEAAAQTDDLRTILESLTSSRRSFLQSASCGGLHLLLLPLLATWCVRLNTIGHVINV